MFEQGESGDESETKTPRGTTIPRETVTLSTPTMRPPSSMPTKNALGFFARTIAQNLDEYCKLKASRKKENRVNLHERELNALKARIEKG